MTGWEKHRFLALSHIIFFDDDSGTLETCLFLLIQLEGTMAMFHYNSLPLGRGVGGGGVVLREIAIHVHLPCARGLELAQQIFICILAGLRQKGSPKPVRVRWGLLESCSRFLL